MATRARNATLTFGLTVMAVKLTSARDKPVEMKNLCQGQPGKDAHDPTPVTQPKHCATCGPITAYETLVKGIPNGTGFTVQSQDDVAEKKAEFANEYKKSLNFIPHPTTEILAMTGPGESLNYVTPADTKGEDNYQMLVRLLKKRPDMTLATLHTPVSATNLFILTLRNGALALEQRTRTEELREAPKVGGEVNKRLYKVMEATADMLLCPYVPEEYEDGYQKHLKALVEADMPDNVTHITTATSVVTDHMDDLRAKLQALMEGAA